MNKDAVGKTIMVIDDEPGVLTMVAKALISEGHTVVTEENPVLAVERIKEVLPDLVISDIKMPRMTGLEVLASVKQFDASINVVLMTAFASVETAIDALRGGAYDYLVKPFKINDLRSVVRRALGARKIPHVDKRSIAQRFTSLICKSPAMNEIGRVIEKVAKTDATVLLTGESGTGKELVAQTLHSLSKRSASPFVSVNCAAMPETLLESELFGFEKGAFTGAQQQKVGLFEYADKGTLFLDEIGDISANTQVMLLRVLQEREIKRIGSNEMIKIDVRVIAATNKKLDEAIRNGTFREDLYYRLNVIPIALPPLRERMEDFDSLFDFFVADANTRMGIDRHLLLSHEAKKIFQLYSWPGNVRELEHCVERLMIMSDDDRVTPEVIRKIVGPGIDQMSIQSAIGSSEGSLRDKSAEFEKDLIVKTLHETRGNKNRAAKLLHMTRQALQYKIRKYAITITA